MPELKEKRAVSLMISTNAMAIAFDQAQELVQGIFHFRHALDGNEEVLDRLRAPGPKWRPNRKECDRCGHRPGRRVQCRICKRAVGPCCLETENPAPLCKDCWEPEPEQRRSQRD